MSGYTSGVLIARAIPISRSHDLDPDMQYHSSVLRTQCQQHWAPHVGVRLMNVLLQVGHRSADKVSSLSPRPILNKRRSIRSKKLFDNRTCCATRAIWFRCPTVECKSDFERVLLWKLSRMECGFVCPRMNLGERLINGDVV